MGRTLGQIRHTLRTALALLCTAACLSADELKPETGKAFDEYVKATEAELKERLHPEKFLWLDQHDHEKSLVWLNQNFVVAHKTLNHGEEMRVPGGVLQDWIGVIFLTGATIDRARDIILDYGNYKWYFKQDVIESRQVKRDGDKFDAYLRLYRRQFEAVALDSRYSIQYGSLDPAHYYIDSHSIRIGASQRRKKVATEGEPDIGEESGFLWRLNTYWRLEQADGGVYAEVEEISLARAVSRLGPGRVLNGFIDNFPKQFVQTLLDGLKQAAVPSH
jgi:hypothetical protein